MEPSGERSSNGYKRITEGRPKLPDQLEQLNEQINLVWEGLNPLVQDLFFLLSLHIFDQDEQIKISSKQIDELRSQNTDLSNKLSITEGGHDEIHANYMYLKQEVNAVVHQNEKLKWKLKSLEQEQKEINNRLTKALKENFQLRQQLKGSEQQIELAHTLEDSGLREKNKELSIRISELEKRLEEKFDKEEDSRLIYQSKLTGIPAVDIDLKLIRQLKAENAFLDSKLSEVLAINRRTSNITNILIEMRKQMLKLQNIIPEE